MAKIAVLLRLDEDMDNVLQGALARLNGEVGEVLLDLSLLDRISPQGVHAMEDFVMCAHERGITVGLRGTHIEVYKVLKLMNLASRFAPVFWEETAPKQES